MTRSRRRARVAAWVLAACGAGVAWPAASGCSLLVTSETAQCVSSADCLKFGPARCISGGCVRLTANTDAGGDGGDAPCTANQDCIGRSGRTWICRKEDSRCVPLLSRDCGLVIGDTNNDSSVVLGALLPTLGAQQSAGLAMTNALRLGVSELSSLPLASRRPVVVVVCDETRDVASAATHLTADLRVPAILGAMTSSATHDAASAVTNAAGVLLLSPTASAGLDTVSGAGLVAELAAGDALQGRALALVGNEIVVPRARVRSSAAALRIAVVRRGDVHGAALHDGLVTQLTINGAPVSDASNKANVLDVDYGDSDGADATDPRVTAAVTAVTQAVPDVVVILGYAEGATRLLGDIERLWPDGAARPLYLLSSGLMTADLFAVVAAGDRFDLARRIVGTAPGSDPARSASFARLLVRYAQTFPDAPTGRSYGVAHAYDAFYALNYALAASASAPSESRGRATARALARLDVAGGTAVDVGPDGVATALAALSAGGDLATTGATGRLDLHTDGAAPASDVQAWCVVRDAVADTASFVYAGRYLPIGGSGLEGAFSPTCALLP